MKDKYLRSFDIRVATHLNSVEKAIVLYTFDYWLKKTKNRDKKNRPYIYNPVASKVNNSWLDQFPYFSVNKLIRIFNALISERFIATMNNNKRKYDKTKSYYLTSKYYKMINAFVETEKSNSRNEQIESLKMSRSNSRNEEIELLKMSISSTQSEDIELRKMGRPIPNNTTNNTRQIIPTNNTTNTVAERLSSSLSGSVAEELIVSASVDQYSLAQDAPASIPSHSLSGSAQVVTPEGSAESYRDYLFQSLDAEPSTYGDLPTTADKFLEWLRNDPRSVAELVTDLLLSQNRKFCDYYIEQLHTEKQVDFILKINDILDSKVYCNDDTYSYSLPSELFVRAMQSNYLTGEQIKSMNTWTYSIAYSRKQKARKKYLESKVGINNTEQEPSTIIQSLTLEKENENISAAEFERVFGKQEYN